jgi:hypothetical protein
MKSSVVTAWLLAVALIVSATHAFNIGPPAYEELEMQCVTTPEGEPSVTVCWGSHVDQPDLGRYVDMVNLVTHFFKLPTHPPVTFNVLPYKEFELRGVLKFPVFGPQIALDGVLLSAYCEIAEDGSGIMIDSFRDLEDKLIVHEFLHAVLDAVTVRGLGNDHAIIRPLTDIIITSLEYRAWRRAKH